MERLGPQDASFLYLETPSNHNHVGGLAILDPSTGPGETLRFDDLVTLISSRLHLVPRFRQKVVFPPIPIARPVWVDDAHFDIDFHLRRAALPAPCGRKELIDYVQRVISRPLDRTKPLWEMYLIEGMENGLVSILTKVHHAMIDGLSGVDIATAVFDFSPVPQVLSAPEWTPEPEPDRATLAREALRDGILHPLVGGDHGVRADARRAGRGCRGHRFDPGRHPDAPRRRRHGAPEPVQPAGRPEPTLLDGRGAGADVQGHQERAGRHRERRGPRDRGGGRAPPVRRTRPRRRRAACSGRWSPCRCAPTTNGPPWATGSPRSSSTCPSGR